MVGAVKHKVVIGHDILSILSRKMRIVSVVRYRWVKSTSSQSIFRS